MYLFVIHELSNKIVSYSVAYTSTGLKFEEVDEVSTFGNETTPAGAAAAEIVIVSLPPSILLPLHYTATEHPYDMAILKHEISRPIASF